MERCAAQGEVWERSDYGIEIFDTVLPATLPATSSIASNIASKEMGTLVDIYNRLK